MKKVTYQLADAQNCVYKTAYVHPLKSKCPSNQVNFIIEVYEDKTKQKFLHYELPELGRAWGGDKIETTELPEYAILSK